MSETTIHSPALRLVLCVTSKILPLGLLFFPRATPAQVAFVTDVASDQVQIVDWRASPPAVVDSVTVETGPVGITLDRGGDRFFVTNSGAGSVSIVDRRGPGAPDVTTLVTGTTPSGIAVDSAGERLYVTDFEEGTLTVIDLVAIPPALLTAVLVGTHPEGVVISSDDSRIYVADADDNQGSMSTLLVLDASVFPPAVIDTTQVPPEAHGIALGPQGRIYLPSSDDNRVSIYDPTTLVVLDSVAVPGRPYSVAVDSAGARLYVSRTDLDSLAVVDLTASPLMVVDEPEVGSAAFGVDLDADGSRVFVPATSTGNLLIFDATSLPMTLIDSVPVGGLPVSFGHFVADSGRVFQDGFESGDTSAWSATSQNASKPPLP